MYVSRSTKKDIKVNFVEQKGQGFATFKSLENYSIKYIGGTSLAVFRVSSEKEKSLQEIFPFLGKKLFSSKISHYFAFCSLAKKKQKFSFFSNLFHQKMRNLLLQLQKYFSEISHSFHIFFCIFS